MTGMTEALRCSVLMLCMLLASVTSFAQNDPAQGGKDALVQRSILIKRGLVNQYEKHEGRDIFVPNLSLEQFLVSYNSKNPEEQSAAYAFLLGVVDASEGKTWCSYYKFKKTTVLEMIHAGLKELSPSHYDERAAHIIIGVLEKQHPCGKEH
ncbi:MAG: hypothetical protein LBI92_08890 [Azoarcus sp.]|jgi:hypothetical protein|nr:hypothetical protein [Azoarcus sp.]